MSPYSLNDVATVIARSLWRFFFFFKHYSIYNANYKTIKLYNVKNRGLEEVIAYFISLVYSNLCSLWISS